jgi:hypothetical protein
LSDEGDWELFNAQGKQVARVSVEAGEYWVAHPRCFPEPPLETLEEAARRAVSLAVAALPNPRPKSSKRKRERTPTPISLVEQASDDH